MARGHVTISSVLAGALLLAGCTGGSSAAPRSGEQSSPAAVVPIPAVVIEQPVSLGLTWADGTPVLVGDLAAARDVSTQDDFTREAAIVDLAPVRERADGTLVVQQAGAVDMGSMTILESDCLGTIRAGGTMDPFTAVGAPGGGATSIIDVDVTEDAVVWLDTTSLHWTHWRVLTATNEGSAAVVASSDEFGGEGQIGPAPQPMMFDGRVYLTVPGPGSPGDGTYTPGVLVSRAPDGSDHRVAVERVDWTAATDSDLYVAQGREDEATTISVVQREGGAEPILQAETVIHAAEAHGRWLALSTDTHAVMVDPMTREAYAIPVADSVQVSSVTVGADLVVWTFVGERSDVQMPTTIVDLRSREVVRLTGLLGSAVALGGDLLVLQSWGDDGSSGTDGGQSVLVRWQRGGAPVTP